MLRSWAVAASSCAFLPFIAGCAGTQFGSKTQNLAVEGATLQGKVHGGQNPIVGAHVYLYEVNANGYGGPGIVASSSNASISMLTGAGGTSEDSNGNYYVTTDSNGAFTITGDYTCPAANSQVYLYAIGGNPGSGVNPAAGLLAGLGSCGSLNSTTFVTINEVSTIATAYAIAAFATDATHVSSSGSALAQTGIANAFAAVANLETLKTGVALATTPAGNGTAPQSEINTLADLLAGCVNSTGPSSSTCIGLLDNAKNPLTTLAPTETATAAINIAHLPGRNVDSLYNWLMADAPFQPDLPYAPNDFTISILYTGGGLGGSGNVAIDASGNVWVANGWASDISEFSPTGAVLSGSSGFTGGGTQYPGLIAFDPSGDLWVGGVGLSVFNSSGSPISGSSPYTGGGYSYPESMAIDALGNVWISSYLGAVSEFNSSGSPVSGASGYTGGGLDASEGIAVDTSGNVWIANINNSSISEFNSSGSPLSGASGYTGGGLYSPVGIAIDASGNVWAPNSTGDSLSEFNSSGSPISGVNGYTGGGLNLPWNIAIDGSGNVWTTSPVAPGNLSEFNSSGSAISGTHGFQNAGFDSPLNLAIDGSGNIWVANSLGSTGSIVEFIGAATPVVTPKVANLLSPYGSHAVNEP